MSTISNAKEVYEAAVYAANKAIARAIRRPTAANQELASDMRALEQDAEKALREAEQSAA